MNILLAITPDQYTQKIIETTSFGETLGFGAMMLGIGMLAVFAVLCVLWGALVIFKIAFYDVPNKKKASAEAKPVEATPTPAPTTTANEDEELIAVFAAAIAMAESECLGAKFRVVSFKRK